MGIQTASECIRLHPRMNTLNNPQSYVGTSPARLSTSPFAWARAAHRVDTHWARSVRTVPGKRKTGTVVLHVSDLARSGHRLGVHAVMMMEGSGNTV